METGEARLILEDIMSEVNGIDEAEFTDWLKENRGVNTVRFVDEKLRDCLSGSLDRYLMQRTYAVDYRNHEFYVDINYGDHTRKITDYSIY